MTVPRYTTTLKTFTSSRTRTHNRDRVLPARELSIMKFFVRGSLKQNRALLWFSCLAFTGLLSACDNNNSSDGRGEAPVVNESPAAPDNEQDVTGTDEPENEAPSNEAPEAEQPSDQDPVNDGSTDEDPTAEVPPTQPANPAPPPETQIPESDSASTLFDLGVVLDVDIQMATEDWQAVANDGRDKYRADGAPCFPGYTWYTGTVTIQGETHEEVSIRKKGNWSANSTKPALKLDFGKGQYDDRELQGERRFTLNNNVQDRLHVKQCLSYSLFAEAGVHAPRCNFARVTAQSRDLGVYTNVEPIKKPFLGYSFGNKSGNLYETSGDAAFIESRIAYFERKTNEDDTGRSELMAVVNAMQVSDEQLWGEMNRVINLENFINFAAMEALVGHADGFTSINNNAYIYHNPDDNRLYFIPWGTDQTFRASHILDWTNETPASIMRGSHLTRRLWDSEEFRTRYDTRLRELLDTVWDEESIKARAAYMGSLIGISSSELRSLYNFIDERREKVEAELAGGADRLGDWIVEEAADAPPLQCTIDDNGDVVALQ